MDTILVIGCTTIGVLMVVIAWQLRRRKRLPRLKSSVVIAECLQPQVVCRSVPCQHPYYRVISEYSGHKIPLENEPVSVKVDLVQKTGTIAQKDWYRTLSLSSIPRKAGHNPYSSRRSSTSDVLDKNSPIRVTKARSPTIA